MVLKKHPTGCRQVQETNRHPLAILTRQQYAQITVQMYGFLNWQIGGLLKAQAENPSRFISCRQKRG